MLLEVGLGGRLDATNVVDHDVSVITSLAVDHVDWLGDDINVIGYEKAGIFRAGRPAICGQPKPPATVPAHADDIHAEFYQTGIQFDYHLTSEHTWTWQHGSFMLENLPVPVLPLMNANTALMALGAAELDLTDVNIVNGLKQARLPGRMQMLTGTPVTILDVAHNPHSAEYLVAQLSKHYPNRRFKVVIGMLHDKDIEETIRVLNPLTEDWYPTSRIRPRAASADELCQYLTSEHDPKRYANPVSAYQAAINEAKPDDMILVVGSFHTVGEVLEYCETLDTQDH